MEDEPYPNAKLNLYPCDLCGRNFNQNSLAKHRNACKKLANPKRKVFDSGRQRALGSDVVYAKTKETIKVQVEGEKPRLPPSKNNWREKHQNFLKAVREARIISEAEKTGAPIPKFQPSGVPSDYVNCPYCNRNFSQSAADRHIKFCETQHKRQKVNNNSGNARIPPPAKAPPPRQQPQQQRKQPIDAYGGGYSSAGGGYGGGYGMPASGGGGYGGQQSDGGYGSRYNSGNSSNYGGYSSGRNTNSNQSERKPVKYDSRGGKSSGSTSGSQSGYGNNNYGSNNYQDSNNLLRTGRNLSNNELNMLARNRSGSNSMKQKDLPNKNRKPPGQQQQPNGEKTTYARGPAGAAPVANRSGPAGGGGFCGECGSEFPVEWAKFCSFCGDRRF